MQVANVIKLRRLEVNIIDLTADRAVSAAHHTLGQQLPGTSISIA